MTTDQEKYVTGFGEDALSRQILKHKLEACSGASSVRKNLNFQPTKNTGYVRVLPQEADDIKHVLTKPFHIVLIETFAKKLIDQID